LRLNDDVVKAHLLDEGHYLLLRTRADREHGNHGSTPKIIPSMVSNERSLC